MHIPEYLKSRMRKLAVFKQEYKAGFSREPDPEVICGTLHISFHSLRYLEKTLLNMQTRSLDEYISDDGGSSLMEMLAADDRVDELAGGSEYQRELHAELESALSLLDQKTALMIRCAYYQGYGYVRTARIFGFSRQAVDERIKKGFYKILHSKYREKLFEKSLVIRERVLGEDHPDTATSYNNLAGVYNRQGEHEIAIIYYLKAYKIFIFKLGLKHPDTRIVYENMEIIYSEWNPKSNFEQWLAKKMKE